jgi:hypothetical protein
MFSRTKTWCISILLLLSAVFCAGSSAIAQDAAWHIGKASGDVWVTKQGVQPASLTNETTIKPGDTIRTGQTGRVLLVRGKESILISPNSVIDIPTKNADGMSTTIIQRAGSILLEVEKRNVRHFEVDTPYLAAVVKGTQFRVTVEEGRSHVNVLRGQVEVVDFKSGQFALVTPGQMAEVSADEPSGLSLSGAGPFRAIQYGTPRSSPVTPVPVRTAGPLAPTGGAQSEQSHVAAAGPLSLSLGGNGAIGAIHRDTPNSSSVAPVSIWATGLMAPNTGSKPEQIHAALPEGNIKSPLASSEQKIPGSEVREPDPKASDKKTVARDRRDKDVSEADTPPHSGFISSLAMPFEIGLFVTFAMMIYRRKEKKKDAHPPEYDY